MANTLDKQIYEIKLFHPVSDLDTWYNYNVIINYYAAAE